MKTIKRISVVALFIIVAIIFISWKNYEKSPALGYLTKTNMLTSGLWEITEFDGYYPNFKMTLKFDADNDVKLTVNKCGYDRCFFGEWWWSKGTETIKLSANDRISKWDVRRLTYNDFWFKDENNQYFKFTKKKY